MACFLYTLHDCISKVSSWQSVWEGQKPSEPTAVSLWPPPTHIHLFFTKAHFNKAIPFPDWKLKYVFSEFVTLFFDKRVFYVHLLLLRKWFTVYHLCSAAKWDNTSILYQHQSASAVLIFNFTHLAMLCILLMIIYQKLFCGSILQKQE